MGYAASDGSEVSEGKEGGSDASESSEAKEARIEDIKQCHNAEFQAYTNKPWDNVLDLGCVFKF